MLDDNGGADISAKIVGQEIRVRNIKSLNTVVTILTFTVTAMIAFLLWEHRNDERVSKLDFIAAVKELTVAQRESTAVQREQNCLLSFPSDRRAAQRDFCKSVAGTSR